MPFVTTRNVVGPHGEMLATDTPIPESWAVDFEEIVRELLAGGALVEVDVAEHRSSLSPVDIHSVGGKAVRGNTGSNTAKRGT